MAPSETTIGMRELRARLGQVIAGLDRHAEVIITRYGRPCAKLTAVEGPNRPEKASLASLRDRLPRLPDASYDDFQQLKAIWGPSRPPEPLPNRDQE